MLTLTQIVKAEGSFIQGSISNERDEDYDPHEAVFRGEISTKTRSYLKTRDVGILLKEIQELYDQMVAMDAANKLEHEEDEIPDI